MFLVSCFPGPNEGDELFMTEFCSAIPEVEKVLSFAKDPPQANKVQCSFERLAQLT